MVRPGHDTLPQSRVTYPLVVRTLWIDLYQHDSDRLRSTLYVDDYGTHTGGVSTTPTKIQSELWSVKGIGPHHSYSKWETLSRGSLTPVGPPVTLRYSVPVRSPTFVTSWSSPVLFTVRERNRKRGKERERKHFRQTRRVVHAHRKYNWQDSERVQSGLGGGLPE